MREFKILSVYLKQFKQDYPNFGLTYFYEYVFPNGFDVWSKDNTFGPKEADH